MKAVLTILLSISMLVVAIATAQPLTEFDWGDAQLRDCVLQLAEKHQWQTAADITDIKCHSKGIESAQSLSKLTSLKKLSLFNNEIKRLDISSLTQLEFLNLANNDLEYLNISGLSNLTKLYLFRNNLSSLDLSGLGSLTEMRLMQNQLESLDITPLIALEQAHIFDNQLEDLSIEGLNQLTFLDVRQNPMPDELYDFYDEQQGIVISHDGNADDWK